MNMFNVLYHKYIEQVKQEEIEKYNAKHMEYLIRSGKLNNKENSKKANNSNVNNANKNLNNYDDRPIQVKNKTDQRKRQFKRPKFQNVNRSNNNSSNGPINNQNGSFEVDNAHQTIKNPQNKKIVINNKGRPEYQQQYKEQKPTTNSNYQNYQRQQLKTNMPERQIKTKEKPLSFQQQVQQSQNVVLIQCPEGCGRKFNEKVLEKHAKNCRKIFQQKRKPFKVKVVQPEAEDVKKQQKKPSTNTTTQNKVPKWKKQSEQLRKTIGTTSNKNKQSQVNEAPPQDDRIFCGGCGRKFNQKAAQKHIPNCLQRNKK